jgi:hypothetical protein
MSRDELESKRKKYEKIEEKINDRFPLPNGFYPGWEDKADSHHMAWNIYEIVKEIGEYKKEYFDIIIDILARISASGDLDNTLRYLSDIDEKLYNLYLYATSSEKRKNVNIASKFTLEEYGLIRIYEERYQFWTIKDVKRSVLEKYENERVFQLIQGVAERLGKGKFQAMRIIAEDVRRKNLIGLISKRNLDLRSGKEFDDIVYYISKDLNCIKFYSIYTEVVQRIDSKRQTMSNDKKYECEER